MISSESEKSTIKKFVPKKSMELGEFLKNEGITKNLEKYIILVNGNKANINQIVEKNDEIIVLPLLRGG